MPHTPGPWILKESQRAPTFYIFGKDSHIATMNSERDFYNATIPDARLIAAAPILLAMCKGTAIAIENILGPDDPVLTGIDAAMFSGILQGLHAAIEGAENADH